MALFLPLHLMPDIFLEEWAANHGVHPRTAQSWAKLKKIPAKIVKTRVLVERSIRKYVVDKKTPLPE